MAVPETYDLVLPLLEIIKDKDEYKVKEIIGEVIEYIDLPDEEGALKAGMAGRFAAIVLSGSREY